MTLPQDKSLAARAKQLRDSPTPQEQRLWDNFLSMHPLRFRRQRVIGRYIVDFYCDEARLALEVEGFRRSEEPAKRHDQRRSVFLAAHDILVLRFSAQDIDRNFCEVCEAINKAAQSLLPAQDGGGVQASGSSCRPLGEKG